jgi:hypothetical protein
MFDRVVCDRTKSVTWSMRYKDEAGKWCKLTLEQDQPMRESGDRLTSSGNFFQNFLAWVTFLVLEDGLDAALASLLRNKGSMMFYASARDFHDYVALLAFEGDDTLCKLQEPVWEAIEWSGVSHVDDFFYRWGWKPKMQWKKTVGFDYVRFVGYDFLIHDNHAVFEGDKLVMCPEIKRILTTKQWCTMTGTDDEKSMCFKVYALAMADLYVDVPPMYMFMKEMYERNVNASAVVGDDKQRELCMLINGVLPEHHSQEMMSFVSEQTFPVMGPGGNNWTELCRASAGNFTDLEWATCNAQPNFHQHGADLRLHFPASWTDRVPAVYGAPPGLDGV